LPSLEIAAWLGERARQVLELREHEQALVGEVEVQEAVAAPERAAVAAEQPIPTARAVVTSRAAPEAVTSILRCGNYLRRTVAERGSPYIAQYNGTKRCPLCSQVFQRGQAMIKCYVDPSPAFRWIHIACANEILAAHGRQTVNMV